jgi:hypothetical protein
MQMTPYRNIVARAPQSGPCMIDITTDGMLVEKGRQEPGGASQRSFYVPLCSDFMT